MTTATYTSKLELQLEELLKRVETIGLATEVVLGPKAYKKVMEDACRMAERNFQRPPKKIEEITIKRRTFPVLRTFSSDFDVAISYVTS